MFRRLQIAEWRWRFDGDEGIEARRANIDDDEPHSVVITMHNVDPDLLDLDALLRDSVLTLYYSGNDENDYASGNTRDHATLKLVNDTVSIALLDNTWLAMPACQLFEDLGATIPDHAARALGSVSDAERELQMLDDNLLYPPFREAHAHELEALFERRRQLPEIIARRLAHWEHAARGTVEPRVWPGRRRGDPAITEHHFAQLGAVPVFARSTTRWTERSHGWKPVWHTTHALVVDGRELAIHNEPFSIGDVSASEPAGEPLGGARYRVRVVTARGPGELVFDLDAMTVELARLWPTGAS